MRLAPGQTAAEREAATVVNDYGFKGPPVCPFKIAEELDILVQSKVIEGGGITGFIARSGDTIGIMYSAHLDNDGFIRFTVAHELGHYFMPGHIGIVFKAGDVHYSRYGFESSQPHEREADFFATALLMPQLFFKVEMNKLAPGIDAVKKLAEIFQTSLTATAIRYAQLTPDPIAVLVSTGRSVEYCFLSDTLQDIPRCQWPKKGTPLHPATATLKFNLDPELRGTCEEQFGAGTLDQWLRGAPMVTVQEEVFGLGTYGKTLTVVFSDNPIDTDDFEERTEDEEEEQDLRLLSQRGYFPKRTRRR